MSNARNSARERFQYGMCLNDECPMCKSKTIQQVPMRKELVCSECGKELRECAAPKKKSPMPILIGVGAVVLIGIIIGVSVVLTKKAKQKAAIREAQAIEQARLDSIAQAEAAFAAEQARLAAEEQARLEAEEAARLAAEEEANAAAQKKATTGSVSYGKWTGAWKNGKPHGTGTMTYRESHLIDSRDPQKRTALAGDYIIGEFSDGKLVQGVWYDKSNNQKGSIIIGK